LVAKIGACAESHVSHLFSECDYDAVLRSNTLVINKNFP